MSDRNMINWFEIPAVGFERACVFYSKVLGIEIERTAMGEFKMGMMPMFEGKVSGAIVTGEGYTPSLEGVCIYLNADPDLNDALGRVEAAGGKILVPKTPITPEYGFFAVIVDTEGNKIHLHSNG
ncbi:MAG: VOC family protein [Ignavibacteriaceae bacterium]|nr:VOC family protein [Ignavibacteriaceae bacterium]